MKEKHKVLQEELTRGSDPVGARVAGMSAKE